ncbi:MAG: sensor histidine kinase [Anaerostipes sp.]|nr:sensor histidine kinase [Anaerostipes sp.]
MEENKQNYHFLWKEYVKEQRYWLGAILSAALIFVLIFWLCRLPLDVLLYLSCLYFIFQGSIFLYQYTKFQKRHEELDGMGVQMEVLEEILPKRQTVCEGDYQKIIYRLLEKNRLQKQEQEKKEKEASDYETLWAHQIKVPITAMELILQTQECEYKEELRGKLFDIEGYVEMMLCYQRLGSLYGDLSICSCNLEDIVRKAVRKYARMFIRKRIQLDFQEFHCQVLTDKKWLLFVIEQILSNALKYTNQGIVTIVCDCEKKILTIKDTGIGIAPEDMPRIYERGFTGENGRLEGKSTGLGLYLCRRIAEELSHELWIESQKGKGTRVCLRLDHITIL